MPKKRGGRKRLIETQPQLQSSFQKVLEDHTAGDPMKPDSLWTNLSVQAIADRMAEVGTPVDRTIVEQLLDLNKLGQRQLLKMTTMGYSRDRNLQFETIALYRNLYLDSLNPILSVDTKKRELLGDFYRDGQAFTPDPSECSTTIIRRSLTAMSFRTAYSISNATGATSAWAAAMTPANSRATASSNGGPPKDMRPGLMPTRYCCCATAAAVTASDDTCSSRISKTLPTASTRKFVWRNDDDPRPTAL